MEKIANWSSTHFKGHWSFWTLPNSNRACVSSDRWVVYRALQPGPHHLAGVFNAIHSVVIAVLLGSNHSRHNSCENKTSTARPKRIPPRCHWIFGIFYLYAGQVIISLIPNSTCYTRMHKHTLAVRLPTNIITQYFPQRDGKGRV